MPRVGAAAAAGVCAAAGACAAGAGALPPPATFASCCWACCTAAMEGMGGCLALGTAGGAAAPVQGKWECVCMCVCVFVLCV
jgi:hypothetical protein